MTGSPDQDTQKALKHAVAYGMEKNTSASQPSTPEQEEQAEYAEFERQQSEAPEPEPTPEERLDALETTTDDMILLMAELIGGN